MRLSKLGSLTVTLIIAATAGSTRGAEAESLVLKNRYVQRELRRVDGSWRTIRFARADGSDAFDVESDEFHILPELARELCATLEAWMAECEASERGEDYIEEEEHAQ